VDSRPPLRQFYVLQQFAVLAGNDAGEALRNSKALARSQRKPRFGINAPCGAEFLLPSIGSVCAGDYGRPTVGNAAALF